MSVDINAVQAEIAKLEGLWSTATQQYAARKAALAAQVDEYIAGHQTQATAHSAEIQAAQLIKAKLVPAAAAAEVAASDLNQFLLTTQPWYQRLVANIHRNGRWYLYGAVLLGLGYVIVHLHK